MRQQYDLDKIFRDVKFLKRLDALEIEAYANNKINSMRKVELSPFEYEMSDINRERMALLKQKSKLIRDDQSDLVLHSFPTREEMIKSEFHGLKKLRLLRENRSEYERIKIKLQVLSAKYTSIDYEYQIACLNLEHKLRASGLREKLAMARSQLQKIDCAKSLDDLNMSLDEALEFLKNYTNSSMEKVVPSSHHTKMESVLKHYVLKPVGGSCITFPVSEDSKRLTKLNDSFKRDDVEINR